MQERPACRAARHRRSKRGVLAYVALGAACAIAAYWAIFTEFAPYDDEGTLLVDLWSFLHGHVLYRDIFAQYGPFYYEVFGGFFALTGKAVSTDAGRLIVVAVWVAASLILGVVSHRLTRRLSLGLGGLAVAFAPLGALTAEPMHPIGLSLLLLALLALVAVFSSGHRPVFTGALVGALIAALTMTKINLGLFALSALVFAAAVTTPFVRRHRIGRWVIPVSFGLLPVALVHADLREGWVRDLAFLATVSIAALAVTATQEAWDTKSAPPNRWLIAAACAFVTTTVIVLAVAIATGPSLSEIYDNIVRDAARGRELFVIPFTLPPAAAEWAVASLALAAIVVAVRRYSSAPPRWLAWARIAAGLAIWFTIAQVAPFGLKPGSNAVALPMTLAWVATVPPASGDSWYCPGFVRVFLPALAVAETLQVYPVAGSQLLGSAVLYGPVGALCLADGLRELETSRRADDRSLAAPTITRIATWALSLMLIWSTVVSPGISSGVQYADQPALSFAGATRLHLPADQAGTYESLVELIRMHCRALGTYPGLNSFYIWAGIRPTRQNTPTAWMTVLSYERQEQVVRELQQSAQPCAIRNDQLADNWLEGRPAQGPLVVYLLGHFHSVKQIGGYQFMLPNAR